MVNGKSKTSNPELNLRKTKDDAEKSRPLPQLTISACVGVAICIIQPTANESSAPLPAGYAVESGRHIIASGDKSPDTGDYLDVQDESRQ